MKKLSVVNVRPNPLVIFWLGLLTGALVVGLVFLYRFMSLTEFQTSVLNVRPSLQLSQPSKVNKITSPVKQLSPSKVKPVNLKQLPTPPGG